MAGILDRLAERLNLLLEPRSSAAVIDESEMDEASPTVGIVGTPNSNRVKDIRSERENQAISTALTSVFTKLHASKAEYKQAFKDLETYYLVDAIFNQLAEDSLTPDITTGEVVTLTSDNTEIKSALEDLQQKVNLDQIVNDFILDLLQDGDYYLRIKATKDVGVEGVYDDVDQNMILALYDKGLPSRFMIKGAKQVKLVAPYQYVHFVLGKSKLRIKVTDFTGNNITNETDSFRIPNYVRVGRPVLYGVISKIKELLLLEKLIPASKINQLSSGNLVSVAMPGHTTPEKAFEVARQVEQVLNQKVGLNKSTGELSVTDIISTAGRIKVIPAFGDKGALATVDARDSRSVDDLTTNVKDLRDIILSSVGIPPQLIFGGDSTKADLLKRYARYLRRLKTIQSSIANGLVQLAMIDLVNKGINANPHDIKVEFKNEIVNIDELDKLEYHDAIIGMSEKILSVLDTMQRSPVLSSAISPEEMAKALKSVLDLSSNLSRIVDPTKLQGKTIADLTKEALAAQQISGGGE